jgi:hypothetical protein
MAEAKLKLVEAIAGFLQDADLFDRVLLSYTEFVESHGLAAFVEFNKYLRERFSPEMKVASKEFEVVKPPPARVYPNLDDGWFLYKPPGIIPKEDGPISHSVDNTLFMLCYAAQFNVGPPEQVALRAKEMVQQDADAFDYGAMARRFAAISIGHFTYIEEYMWTLHPFKVGERIHRFKLCDVSFEMPLTVTKVFKAEVTTSYWLYEVKTDEGHTWQMYDNDLGLCPVSFPLDLDLWKTGHEQQKSRKAKLLEVEYQQKLLDESADVELRLQKELAEIRNRREVRLFHVYFTRGL